MDTDDKVINLPVHTKAGYGKTGYCKICDSPYAHQVNLLLQKKLTYPQISAALEPFEFRFNRGTLRNHKTHSTDPKTTFVRAAQKNPALSEVSNEEYLRQVRNAAAANVAANPEAVTVDQGIKAAQVMMQDRNTRDALGIVLMKTLTGRSDEVIEGEWREAQPTKELTTNNDGADD